MYQIWTLNQIVEFLVQSLKFISDAFKLFNNFNLLISYPFTMLYGFASSLKCETAFLYEVVDYSNLFYVILRILSYSS